METLAVGHLSLGHWQNNHIRSSLQWKVCGWWRPHQWAWKVLCMTKSILGHKRQNPTVAALVLVGGHSSKEVVDLCSAPHLRKDGVLLEELQSSWFHCRASWQPNPWPTLLGNSAERWSLKLELQTSVACTGEAMVMPWTLLYGV